MHVRYLYASGRRTVRGTAGGRLTVVNPATEALVGSCPAATADEIDEAVQAARHAFDHGPWPRRSPYDRAQQLRPLADVYELRADRYAKLITAEMGSPARFTAQTTHPLEIVRYYTDPFHLGPLDPDNRDGFTVTREPAGVVLVITPWNMPHKTIMMKVLPALVAGCTVIVKPAPQTPLDALDLADAFDTLDLPHGVLAVLPTTNERAEYLARHPDIDKIAFTGSTRTGARLAEIAAHGTKRISLELGGKSPMVLLPDLSGDRLAQALATVPDASLLNSGQICSNQTRILVHRDRYKEAAGLLADLVNALRIGDPRDPDTEIGPLVTEEQRNNAMRAITDAVADGATLTAGGTIPKRPGWFLTPTLFTDVHPTSRLYQQEVFAPVLALTPYDTYSEAIALANLSLYGLDGSVWSDDLDEAHAVARELRTGTVRINGAPTPIHAPIGGFKRSGYGRELGPEGLTAFTEPKVTAYP